MSVKSESQGISSPETSHRTYFTLIRVFKKREKSSMERNIVKVIHESRICKSSPILKALLIENVRICCIVVETSGKQSVKILCASAPYIFALICKANPQFENFLRNEKFASCLKILRESDFEFIWNNVYHTTVLVHSGVKKLYTIVGVNFVKDTFLLSEKSLIYLFKLILRELQLVIEFLYDNFMPLFHYLYRQNYAFVSCIIDGFPHLIAKFLKYTIVATVNVQKAIIISLLYMKKVVLKFICVGNHFYTDSAVNNCLKKLYFYCELFLSHVRSSDVYSDMEHTFLHLLHLSKHYLWKYFQKLFEISKNFIRTAVPLIKSTIQNAIKEGIPLLQKFLEENLDSILSAYHTTKTFLCENIHYIKPFCCYTCRILYNSIWYLYNICQTVLPHFIELSSNAVISFMACSTYVLEYCVYLCKILCNHIIPVLENQKRLVCYLSRRAINILKTIYKIILNVQPYMVLIFQITYNELAKLIHILSPTFLACFHEVNSSVFYASKELVAKSCLATKRITPSFYYSAKAVLPPTLLAVHEIMKSSKNSVVIISPAVLKFILTIRPEVEEGFAVLFSDGNKAFLEIASVSYSASYELKDAVKAVSTNMPTIYKALREILTTTAIAAVEVSSTSLSAKTRMLKDFKKAREVVHTSFMLAEQEMVAVYVDLIFEINSVMPISQETILSNTGTINFVGDYFTKFIFYSYCSFIGIFKNVKFGSLLNISTMYFLDIFDLFVDIIYYLLLLTHSVCINIFKFKAPDINKKILRLLCLSFIGTSYIISPSVQNLRYRICSNCSNINAKIIQNICIIISKTWCAIKFNLCATWIKICLLAPEMWTSVEHLASVFWNFIVENLPGVWMTWKTFCFIVWELIYNLVPYAWHYSSIAVSVVWTSGRELTKMLWNSFVTSSSFIWQRTASLSSEYWLLSETYLPPIWFTSCEETRKGWNVTCCLIENCWNFTVGTCSLSWSILHRTVATSWRNSLVFTKTAYCFFTTTGSVLQKSFWVCTKSKSCVCVILQATPKVSDFSLTSFRVPKLRSQLPVNRKTSSGVNMSDELASPEQSSYLCNIKDYISAVMNSVSHVDKLFSYEKIVPFRYFIRNQVIST